jgi:light-regulated signal transduction histidine kinase (bacteriophytochrome)
MAELIDDLLNLSRVVRSDMQFQQKDISGLAREVAGELVETDPGRSVRVDIQEGLSVYADPTLLRIVVQNLMENAWKYTARVESAVIQFGANEQQGETVFFVRDNGIGFDMKYAGKLFVVFQRLHSLDEYEGTGIGLATVQRIVHRHGGRIWAEGKEGEGAVFYFTLGSTGEVGSQQWTAIDSRATYN